MKIKNKLDEILNQTSKVKILRFLFNENDEHTGRTVAKAINMSASSTYTALQEMKEAGVISARRKGNAILYKIRDNDYFVKNLLFPLFKKEKAMYDNIFSIIKRNILVDKQNVVSVVLFGSAAKSQETVNSDIDILIITKNARDISKINKLADSLSIKMAKSFHVAFSPYILTKAELVRKYLKKEPIIKSILDNNKLIYGQPIERLVA